MSAETRFARLRAHFHRLLDEPSPLRSAAMADVEPDLREELLALLAHAEPPIIGPYRIEHEIGRGGMGVVYRARRIDGAFDQVVALKRMHLGLGPERGQRFARERHILARLQHPHIAKLLDGGIDDQGQPWLAMELIDGAPLLDAARNLGIDARLGIAVDLCHAVAFAHAALVVHRDIKPGNVMLGKDGQPRLLDFGIAKLESDSEQSATLTDLRPMTLRYAAPEQRRGERATTAVDIYALGALLVDLFASDLRGNLKRIVAVACAERPELRYGTVAALADDLADARAGRPLRSGIDSRRERALAFARTYAWPLAAALCSALALTAGGLVAWQQARRAAHEAEQARQHLATLIDVIAAVSPDRYRGEEPLAGDVLLAAADAIATREIDQPTLVRMLNELGAGLINLGRSGEARTVLQRAARAEADIAPTQAMETLRLLALIAEDAQIARDLARRIEVLAPRVDMGPARSALASVASSLAHLGEASRARDLLDLAQTRTGTANIIDEENYLRQRAQTLKHIGDWDGAALAWGEVVALHREQPRAFSDERQAEAAWMRADLALLQGQLELARAEFERARPIIETSYPAQHEDRARFDVSCAELALKSGLGDGQLRQVLARIPPESEAARRARSLLGPAP